jgi:uncharacterized protein (TIGR02996 family)
MSLLEGFLQDIIEHPDDDAPRLILADWLDDQGAAYGAASADLIRVQCRLASLPFADDERPGLEAREMLLVHGPANHWASRHRYVLRDWTFHRGLIGEASIQASRLPAHAGQLFRTLPLQRLTLLGLGSASDVAQLRELVRLRGLRLRRCYPRDEMLSALVDSSHLENLRELAIDQVVLSRLAWQRLAQSAWCGQLEVLDLQNTAIAAGDLSGLLRPTRLPRLHTLRLGGSAPSGLPVSAFVGLLPQLRELELDNFSLPDLVRGVAKLPESGVRALTLRHAYRDRQPNPLEPALGQLLALQWVSRLSSLDLAHSHVGVTGARILANAPVARGLLRLGLKGSLIGSEGAEALAGSRNFARLRRLDLDDSDQFTALYPRVIERRLGDEGVAALANSDGFPELRFLSLRRNQISATGLRSILKAPWLEQLHLLDLRQNHLGNDGANLLLARGPWEALARLDVKNNRIEREAKRQLRERFGERVWY